MKGMAKAEGMRLAALLPALLLCAATAVMPAQRRDAPATPRYSAPRSGQGQGVRMRQQQRQQNRQLQRQNQGQFRGQYQRRYQGQGGQMQRQPGQFQGGYGAAPAERPYANSGVARPGTQFARPAPEYQGQRPEAVRPNMGPPGHLGDWLNQHRNLPPQDQERLLRNSPSFNRLPAQTQQRLTQQLHQLNQMPEEQRQRRLARSEMLERLSPQEQAQVRGANQQYRTLPPGRQAMVKQAFQDLRTVPPDQRQTVLNSARYQNNFSPQEREILNNFLRVEP